MYCVYARVHPERVVESPFLLIPHLGPTQKQNEDDQIRTSIDQLQRSVPKLREGGFRPIRPEDLSLSNGDLTSVSCWTALEYYCSQDCL